MSGFAMSCETLQRNTMLCRISLVLVLLWVIRVCRTLRLKEPYSNPYGEGILKGTLL